MSDEQNGNGKSRLDRLERVMELLLDDHLKFSDEHNKLLTAQVVLHGAMQELAAAQKDLIESQKHTDERMGVLIPMMDEFIRGKENHPER